MIHDATDALIRRAAFDHLARLRDVEGELLSWKTLARGFEFRGERVHLLSQQGIFKPRQLALPLSIRTSANSPYADSLGDGDVLRYAYRGTDPTHPENVGLREAMSTRTPLVYFHSIVEGRYLASWPVFVVGDRASELMFDIQVDDRSSLALERSVGADDDSVADDDADLPLRRRYATSVTRRRLFQHTFRERVLAAYRTRCALCRLKHASLLEAAHIIPDSDERGEPRVTNGLSLCRIHHGAFDADILGIDPDGRAVVRDDILEEIDGPMLEHGIQAMHGVRIQMPRSLRARPDRDALAFRFERFRNAG